MREISEKIVENYEWEESRLTAASLQVMGMAIQTIGIARARTKIGMANIAYSIRRLVQLRGAVTT